MKKLESHAHGSSPFLWPPETREICSFLKPHRIRPEGLNSSAFAGVERVEFSDVSPRYRR